jgi:HPr kinase/phosphorylase
VTRAAPCARHASACRSRTRVHAVRHDWPRLSAFNEPSMWFHHGSPSTRTALPTASCFSFFAGRTKFPALMQMHASCAARNGEGVLLVGAPGSGKSDLVLRLLDIGFLLVADDRVDIQDGWASPPAPLAGLLEVRGLGILRLPHASRARLALAVELATPAQLQEGTRLPEPARLTNPDLPLVRIDPSAHSAPRRVALALSSALGHQPMLVGAFA